MKRVLVTGGCGFIGSHFVRLLIQEEPEVRVTNLSEIPTADDRRSRRR